VTSAGRRANLERDLGIAEAEFEEQLRRALETCASGHWGLFGQNGEGWDTGKQLVALGTEIQELRGRVGYTEPNDLFQRLLHYRSQRASNAPGEPRLAKMFLDELKDTLIYFRAIS
jgi:hypothetical protein